MDNPLIREASVADALGIAKVHVRTWKSAYRGLIPNSFLQSMSVEPRAKVWAKDLESPLPKTHTLVAVWDDEIVGFIGVGTARGEGTENKGEIFAIYVDPQTQGRGIGSALMRSGIEILAKDHWKSDTP